MKAQFLTLGILVFCSVAPVAVARDAYRVSGIVTGRDITPVAFVELPGKTYRRLHVGDAFLDGTVVGIESRWVKVSFPDGDKELWLESAKDADAALPSAAPVMADAAVRPVMAREVDRLVVEKGWGEDAQWQEIKDLLARLLALPEGAHIVEVDGVTTGTELSPTEQLRQMLDEGLMIGVTIAGDPARDRVYLAPEQAPPPAEGH